MSTLEKIKPGFLTHELSADIGNYCLNYHTQNGKFIRFGNQVVTSPFNRLSTNLRNTHKYMLDAATSTAALTANVTNEVRRADELGMRRLNYDGRESQLHDAGAIEILHPSAVGLELADELDLGERSLVTVHGWSGLFGRADAKGRETTGRIFQNILDVDDFLVRAHLL